MTIIEAPVVQYNMHTNGNDVLRFCAGAILLAETRPMPQDLNGW